MKLSVCIPVYNQVVDVLVEQLIHQIEQLPNQLEVEICIIDDGSTEEIKQKNKFLIDSQPYVRYLQLPKNVGRSAIRNQLAKYATGTVLIFLDCDVLLPDQFLSNYYSIVLEKTPPFLICGGYKYPEDRSLYPGRELRLTYGQQVEELQIKDGRAFSPFLSGNFIIPKSSFDNIQFEEQLSTYGCEDVLFKEDVEQAFQIEVEIVNNPVLINQIDENLEYIEKMQSSMANMAWLVEQNRIPVENNLRILIAHEQLKSKGLVNSFYTICKSMQPTILYFLDSKQPNLKILQIYKLFLFVKALYKKA